MASDLFILLLLIESSVFVSINNSYYSIIDLKVSDLFILLLLIESSEFVNKIFLTNQ